MKPGIHPEYKPTKITCACGRVSETYATVDELHVEICSHCHPFFTGRQKLVDTAGRVERFRRKYGKGDDPSLYDEDVAEERTPAADAEEVEEAVEAEAEAEEVVEAEAEEVVEAEAEEVVEAEAEEVVEAEEAEPTEDAEKTTE